MKAILVAILAAALLNACSGGSSDTMQPPATAQPTSVNFTSFVKTIVVEHSDVAIPLEVKTVTFVFTDDENPAAFAEVLPPVT